jgi:hypothetical protein
MVYAIQAYVFFRNTARRDNAVEQLDTRYQTDPQFGSPITELATSRDGDPGFYTEARFTNQADRDLLWSQLDAAFGTGVNGPVTGVSVATGHTCPHDEPSLFPCVINLTREW